MRAEVLRALLLSASRSDGQVAALVVVGARITGVLDLTEAQVEPAVRLMGCHFDRPVIMYGARLRWLNLRDSYLPGLDAPELSVEGRLFLSGCRIPGAVRLGGVTVSSTLFLDGARIGTSDGDLDDDEEVLHLGYCSIGSDLYAPGLVAHGKTTLDSATIGRNVHLDRAQLHGPPPP